MFACLPFYIKLPRKIILCFLLTASGVYQAIAAPSSSPLRNIKDGKRMQSRTEQSRMSRPGNFSNSSWWSLHIPWLTFSAPLSTLGENLRRESFESMTCLRIVCAVLSEKKPAFSWVPGSCRRHLAILYTVSRLCYSGERSNNQIEVVVSCAISGLSILEQLTMTLFSS